MRKIISSVCLLSILFSLPLTTASAVESQGKYDRYLGAVEEKVANMDSLQKADFNAKIMAAIQKSSDAEFISFLNKIINLSNQSVTEIPNIIQKDIIDISQSGQKIPYTQLSAREERNVMNSIMEMQSGFESEGQRLLGELISSWNSLQRYTEKGNLTADIDMNIEDFVYLKGAVDISDYFIESQVLDSSISGNVSGYYSTELFGENIEFFGESNIKYIQKGSEYYLLMGNTQFETNSEESRIEITPVVEKLNELAKDNTYLSFRNEYGIDPYEILGYFSEDNLSSEMKVMFSKPLMNSYGKNENGYLLEPSKHMCDMGKRLGNFFDPFYGKDCSEKQYGNMLEDFRESGILITLSQGKDKTLTISNAQSSDPYETIDLQFTWKNGSFNSADMIIKDSLSDRTYLDLAYKSKNSLIIDMPGQEYDPKFKLNTKFNRNGGIKEMNMSSSYEDEFSFNMDYDNGFITATLDINDKNMSIACLFDGEAYTSYVNIKTDCQIASSGIFSEIENIIIDSKFMYNGRNSQNNVSWQLDAQGDTGNYITINIDGKAKRSSSNVYEIKAPNDTLNYIDFLSEFNQNNNSKESYQPDYTYQYNEYEEYSEACYIYDSGDTTCYKYYDDKDITCNYNATTEKENCETYEYNY